MLGLLKTNLSNLFLKRETPGENENFPPPI